LKQLSWAKLKSLLNYGKLMYGKPHQRLLEPRTEGEKFSSVRILTIKLTPLYQEYTLIKKI